MIYSEGMISMENSLPAMQPAGLHRETELLVALLQFEASLARSQAAAGLIPESAARSIVGTCKIELFDVPKIVRERTQYGDLVASMVQNLRETVSLFNQEASGFVHLGCTGGEAIQTATAIVAQRALRDIDDALCTTTTALRQFAELHAATPVLERANYQCVGVSSFGLKCAQWAASLVRCREALGARSRAALRVQWGSTLDNQQCSVDQAERILSFLCKDLALGSVEAMGLSPLQEWLALGCEVGLLAGVLGNMGAELACMGQPQVGEILEPTAPDRFASSAAMGYKLFAACLAAMENAQTAPQSVASLLAQGGHLHSMVQRQVELAPWSHLLLATHAAATGLSQSIPSMQMDGTRMRQNVETQLAALPKAGPGSPFNRTRVAQSEALARRQIDAMGAYMQKWPLTPVQTA